jgi:ABC-type antimicrobial peptide transport system permease subunit
MKSPMCSLALALATLGLFATAAQSVGRRTRELGIRAACGAAPRDLHGLVLRRALLLAVLGVASGAAVAGPLGRLVQAQLRDQSPVDPVLWALVGLGLIAIATLAVLAPARRAARVDPVRALRGE